MEAELREKLKFDSELLVLVAGGLGLAWVVQGYFAMNLLISFLLIFLFLNVGLNFSISQFKRHSHKKKEILAGLLSIFVLAPLYAVLMSAFFSAPVSDALIVLGVASGSIGMATVLSNEVGGQGETSMVISLLSFVLALVFIPIWLQGLGLVDEVRGFLVANFWMTVLPLVVGIGLRRHDVDLSRELQDHFESIALILVVGVLVAQLFFGKATASLSPFEILTGSVSFLLLMGMTAAGALLTGLSLRMDPKQVKAIAASSSIKSLPVSFFLGVPFGPKVIQLILVYYLISRTVVLGFTIRSDLEDGYLQGKLPDILSS